MDGGNAHSPDFCQTRCRDAGGDGLSWFWWWDTRTRLGKNESSSGKAPIQRALILRSLTRLLDPPPHTFPFPCGGLGHTRDAAPEPERESDVCIGRINGANRS